MKYLAVVFAALSLAACNPCPDHSHTDNVGQCVCDDPRFDADPSGTYCALRVQGNLPPTPHLEPRR